MKVCMKSFLLCHIYSKCILYDFTTYREQMLQVLLRITEAVMKRPLENQRKDSFAESLASLIFRVCLLLHIVVLG